MIETIITTTTTTTITGAVRARRRAARTRAHRRARPRWILLLALGLAPLAIPLTGCGSSSEDLASKSPAAILAASRTAARNASAVHVHSQFYATAISVRRKKAKGKPKTKLLPTSTLELQLTSDGGRARLALLGGESEAVRVANTIYVKSGPVFYRNLQRRTGAHVAPGTWLKAPADGAQLAEYTALTEPGGELMLLLRNPTLSLTKGRTTTIKGQKAIELKTEGKLYDGAIYIAATGTPYPLMIVEHGRETGQTTFTGWNDPVTITSPANAVELSGLERHAKD